MGINLLDVMPSQIADNTPKYKESLIVYQNDELSLEYLNQMKAVLNQMKIGYDCVESDSFTIDMVDDYEKLVLALTDYMHISKSIGGIKHWVKNGGNLLILYSPELDSSFSALFDLIGVKDCGSTYSQVNAFHFNKNIIPGSTAHDFELSDPFECALSLSTTDDCEVYMASDDEYPLSLLWRRSAGKGTVVVNNFAIAEKVLRGIYCASYTLLGDSCVYPVINGSVFYIDDFPSPVPGGNGYYVQRDYNLNISDFYTQVWWKDVYNLADKYGFPYTALVIEEYSDEVEPPFDRNTDTQRFQYFGNMVLQGGGEIGFHGYNHMPLVLENIDFNGEYDTYVHWGSYEAMKESIQELKEFCNLLFPGQNCAVYVPPSNIISDEGRQMLTNEFKNVRTIASVYFPGELAFAQEFDVSDSGMINTPRIISGYVLDEFTQLAALSEMSFHYASTHFAHPDDVLDEDRGAELGWAKMYNNLSNYVEWLYTAAPNVRSLTGSELAGAVQRYDYVGVDRTFTDYGMHLEFTNYYDEVWMLLRINNAEKEPTISSGSITKTADGLWLVCADKSEVDIVFK